MKTHPFFFLLCVVCLGLSCKQQQPAETPADTKMTPFDYDEKMLKLMIFKGALNDSIPLNVMFDTGVSLNSIALSDSLAGLLDTTVHLQIGAYKSTLAVYALDRNNHLLRYFDAVVGWRFFKDRVIEISYQHKYIRELDTIPAPNDFFPIKMGDPTQTSNQLTIPVKVHAQGKCMEVDILLDTGANGHISLGKYFVDKYKIDLTDAYHGANMTVGGLHPGSSIPGDSIVLGKFAVPNVRVSFSTVGNPRARMLGSRILEHFTLILDLKNFYLYIKPNE